MNCTLPKSGITQFSQTNLLLHLFHLLHRAPPLRTLIVAVPQQGRADVVGFADVLLLLPLCLFQLVLSTETLGVVHVVCLHDLSQQHFIHKKELKMQSNKPLAGKNKKHTHCRDGKSLSVMYVI